MTDLERHLNEMGVIARPSPTPKPKPTDQTRPHPRDYKGVWYDDGEIPF